MAIELPTIVQRIRLDDRQLAAGAGRAQRTLGGIGRTLGRIAKVGALAAAGGLAAFTAAGVKGAVEVDKGLREVNSLFGLTGQAAEESFRELSSGVADLSDEVGIAQQTLTGGLYQAISAGVPRDNVFEFMKVASQASIAGVTDVETAVDGLTTTINAFGLDASQAQEVADSMFAAVQGGKTTFEELSGALFQVAPSAAAAGVSFQEVNAAVATLTSAGVPTAVATTRMRAAIDELAKGGTVVAERFAELTGKSFPEFTAAGGTLQEALAILADDLGPGAGAAMEALADSTSDVAQAFEERAGKSFQQFVEDGGDVTEALNMVADVTGYTGDAFGDLFGSVEAAGAATILATTGAAKMTEEMKRQRGSANASTRAFEEMEKSSARQMERLRTNVANVGIELGANLLPALNRGVEVLTRNLPGAVDGAKRAFRGLIDGVRTGIDLFQRFRTPILAVAGVLAASYIPQLVAATVATVTNIARQIGAWVALRVQSLGTIASTIAGFVGMAVRAAATTVQVVASIARQVAAWALMGAQSLLHAAKVAAAWLIAMGPIALVIAAVVGLVALIVANWDTIREVTVKVFRAIGRFLTRTWDNIVTALRDAWDRMVARVRGAWDAITGAIRTAVAFVKGLVTGFVRFYVGLWRKLWTTALAVLRGAWNAIRGAVSSAVSALVGLVRNLWSRWVNLVHTIRDAIVRTLRDAWNRARDAVRSGIDRVIGFVKGVPGRILRALGNTGRMLYQAGRNILQGLINGIKAMVGKVSSAISGVAKTIRNKLPFSPAKEGPLSGRGSPDRAGEAIASMVAEGIEDRRKRASVAASKLAASVRSGFGSPALSLAADRTAGSLRGGFGHRTAGTTPAAVGGPSQHVTIERVEARDPAEAARELDAELGWQYRKLASARR